jgi:hypothetical protein
MTYRPHTKEEFESLDKMIDDTKKSIELYQKSLQQLEERKLQGAWDGPIVTIDLNTIEPSCYVCKHKNNPYVKCKKGRPYGIVCAWYKHFSDKETEDKEINNESNSSTRKS